MPHHPRLSRLTLNLLLGISLSGLISTGCSQIKNQQRRAGLRSNTIRLKDMGSDLSGLRGTPHDPFRKQKSRPGLKASKPLKIKYRSFKLKRFDQFIKQVNVLYARYRISKRLTRNYHREVDHLLKTDLKGQSRAALRKSLRRRSLKETRIVRRLGSSYDALKLAFKSTRGLTGEAKALLDKRQGIVDDSIKRLKANPTKAILVDVLLSESKRALTRLTEVSTGTPKLVKSLTRGLDIAKLASAVTGG